MTLGQLADMLDELHDAEEEARLAHAGMERVHDEASHEKFVETFGAAFRREMALRAQEI